MEITRRGAEVSKCPGVAEKVRSCLLVSPFSPMDPYPKRFKVWAETPTKYIVPVHWALEAFSDMKVTDTRSPGADIDVTFAGVLRDDLHQPRAVAGVLEQWRRTDGAMLCAIPGGGKTTMALYLAAHLRKKTLVVVHTSTLREQWKERVRQFLPAASVTEVQGAKCDTTGDVVIAMFQTLASRQYPSSTFRDFHFLVVDECFPGRQLVATETGAMEIARIYGMWKSGTNVFVHSFDESTKTFVLKPVTHVWEKTTAVDLVKIQFAESDVKATPGHKIMCIDGWKCAGEIRTGDLVVSRCGSGLSGTLAVTGVSRYTPKDKRVYDLEVADTHTFVCCGISGTGAVVHNCHHVGAQVLTQALFGLAFPRVLGLSATPTRKDRLTDVMHWFLGPTAFSQTRENQGTTSVVTVKYSSPRYATPPPVNCRGDVDYTGIVSLLVDDDARTRVIAHQVASLARAGRDVLVLSHRREHCKAVCARVTEEGVDAMTYLGGDKVVPSSRVIVATFSLAAEGFDCPRLSALVLATPASDVEQACGRVMRGSVREAVIVDFVDQWGVCFAQAAKRRALYKRCGFTFAAAAASPVAAPSPTFAFLDD